MAEASTIGDLADPFQWSVETVSGWLMEIGLRPYVQSFADNDIDGRTLLSEQRWIPLVSSHDDQEKIRRGIESLRMRIPVTPSDIGSNARLVSQLSFNQYAGKLSLDEYLAQKIAEQEQLLAGLNMNRLEASISVPNLTLPNSGSPLHSDNYTLSIERDQTVEEIARERSIPLDELLGANPTLTAKQQLHRGTKIYLPVIQRLIESTSAREPPVPDSSETVFQHFAGGASNATIIPSSVSDEKLEDVEKKFRTVFLSADLNADGLMTIEELKIFIGKLHLEMRDEDLRALFNDIDQNQRGTITFQQFFQYFKEIINGKMALQSQAALDLFAAFLKADREGRCDLGGVSQFMNQRWEKFNNFKRDGRTGRLVMTGGSEAQDILPGEYSLIDLINGFDITPEDKLPKMIKVVGIRWIPSNQPGQSGRLIFPKHFTEIRLPVETGTNEKLAYYGCCFANETQLKVSLTHRHAIQDFTYLGNYYCEYVRGRAGLERHEFAHLDCPMLEDNGFFVLGKVPDGKQNELHLTAFRIPVKHTLYVPPMTIHSNDYLKGTWRTMLSDATPIDHVRLQRERYDGTYDRFSFDFDV